jgi:HD domain
LQLPADTAFTTEAARACLAELRTLCGERDGPMERHGLRVYEIARELARRRGLDVDNELLACVAWLHDAGLYPGAASADTYVVDGRRLLARVLASFDWPGERVALAGDAVERHHELRPQWKRGAEVELIRRADLIDVSGGAIQFGLGRPWLRDLFVRVPRAGLAREIARLVGGALRSRPLTMLEIFLRRG